MKLRAFQLKILHFALTTNTHLFYYGIRDNWFCSFCTTDKESLEHLFLECVHVRKLWNYVNTLFDFDFEPTIESIILNKVVDNPKKAEMQLYYSQNIIFIPLSARMKESV